MFKCFASVKFFATFLLIQKNFCDPITMSLNVVTNDKLGGSGSWLVFEDGFGSPWSETIFETSQLPYLPNILLVTTFNKERMSL